MGDELNNWVMAHWRSEENGGGGDAAPICSPSYRDRKGVWYRAGTSDEFGTPCILRMEGEPLNAEEISQSKPSPSVAIDAQLAEIKRMLSVALRDGEELRKLCHCTYGYVMQLLSADHRYRGLPQMTYTDPMHSHHFVKMK